MQSEELLRQNRPAEALKALQGEIREAPADAKLRVFMFQLLCVLGDWDRALTQLNVAADLDASKLLMAHICRPALACEALRAEIFAGRRSPLVFGEPEQWVGLMVQANQLSAQGEHAGAQEIRDRAFEAAPAVSGTINGQGFEWIADADPRLGPILEVIVDGRYYWIPFPAIHRINMEPPADLSDMIWAPAHFTWANGGEAAGLIPTRYSGSESSADSAIQLAKKTEWAEPAGGGTTVGLGQRMLATDLGEFPILETREVVLGQVGQGPQAGEQQGG